MPPGGDGLYYFYAHFHVNGPKFARFDIRRNGGVFCVVREDERNGNDNPASSCGAVVTLVEGYTVLHFLCLEFVLGTSVFFGGGGTVTLFRTSCDVCRGIQIMKNNMESRHPNELESTGANFPIRLL